MTDEQDTPKVVIAGIPRSGTRYVFHQLGGKPFRALVGNLIKTHGLAPPDQLSEPMWELVYEALMNDGYKAIFMFGDVTASVISTINNIYDGKHFRNCGAGHIKPKDVILTEKDWLGYERMFDSWMQDHPYPCLCLRYETLPNYAEEFEEFTGVKPDFSNWRPRKTNIEGLSPARREQIETTYASLIAKVKAAPDITIYNGGGRRESKRMEVEKDDVAFFGPWAGEFGWELMTWQAWCRAQAHKYKKVYVCSYPDMEFLYRDFANFIPHNYPKRGLSWENLSHIEKVTGYEIPGDVTKQILPYKRYRVPDQEFVQFGGPHYPAQTIKYFIHARGIKKGGKNWPLDRWQKLVSLFPPNSVASVGSPVDHHIEGSVNLKGIPLEELCYYFAGAKMVIGQSSGVMHLATLCKAPIVVWGDARTYFGEKLDQRYRVTWNPFNSPVQFIYDDDWNPDPEVIANLAIGGKTMEDQKAPNLSELQPNEMQSIQEPEIQADPPPQPPQPQKTIPIGDIPIGKVIRDKLAKATMTGRYFITISCLAPDDRLYHFWRIQDFPHSDVFKTLEHITMEARNKLNKTPEKGKGQVFEWD
jgi:hypothetical protein